MRDSIYRITLDVHDVASQLQIASKQYDTARSIYITLMSNGKPYPIEAGSRAVMRIARPGSTALIDDCVVRLTDGVIIYNFTEYTAESIGINECELRLIGDDDRIITSPRFTMVVSENVYADSSEHGIDHGKLAGRSGADQHPISAITDLEETLDKKADTFELDMAKEDYNRKIDSTDSKLSGVSSKVPFSLGVDVDGNYGYIPNGSSDVIPFAQNGILEVQSTTTNKSITVQSKGKAHCDMTVIKNAGAGYTYTLTVKKNGETVKTEIYNGDGGEYKLMYDVDVDANDVLTFNSSEAGNLNIFATVYVSGSGLNPSGTGPAVWNDVIADVDALRANKADKTNPVINGNLKMSSCTVQGVNATAFGMGSYAGGDQSLAVGSGVQAIGHGSFATGLGTNASARGSVATGGGTKALGEWSHAEGSGTNANGLNSHAEGSTTTADGKSSHAEGDRSRTDSDYCHAEGEETYASGEASHAEGYHSQTSGYSSHAEGYSTTAQGYYSHAEGKETFASGTSSHAGGDNATAGHSASFAHGYNVGTGSNYSAVFGKYNESNPNNAFEVGNGTSIFDCRNAFSVDWSGNGEFGGDVKVTDASGNKIGILSAASEAREAAERATSSAEAVEAELPKIDATIEEAKQEILESALETVRASERAITDKGAEVLASIPEDYSQLSESIDEIDNDVNGIKDDIYGTIIVGKNKLNADALQLNTVIDTNGDVIYSPNGFATTPFIPISASDTKVICSYTNSVGAQSAMEVQGYLCFYDDSLLRVGNRLEGGVSIIPTNAKYFRYSINPGIYVTYASTRVQIELSEEMTPFEPYTETVVGGIMSNVVTKHKITVGSGKDFDSLVSAIDSINDSNEHNQYVIELYEGEYDAIDTSKINSTYRGLYIPDYVSIIGIGNRDNIVIKGELTDEYKQYSINISTINFMANGTIENITITGKNVRYCDHDDSGTTDMISAHHVFKNCKFIYYAPDDGYEVAGAIVGIGTQVDKIVEFIDCEFVTFVGSFCIFVHDNGSRTVAKRGGRLVIDRCHFKTEKTTGTQCICLGNSNGILPCYAVVRDSYLYNGICIRTENPSYHTNMWKLWANGNYKYAVVKDTGLVDVDISNDIVAFGNVNSLD